METYLIFTFFAIIAGIQGGHLPEAAAPLYASAPVELETPVLTETHPTYVVNSPIISHVGSSYNPETVHYTAAPAEIAKTIEPGPIYAEPLAAPFYGAPLEAGNHLFF